MKLNGRVLYLTDDAATLRRQLDGEDLTYGGEALHYGVNTDLMISGATCTGSIRPAASASR